MLGWCARQIFLIIKSKNNCNSFRIIVWKHQGLLQYGIYSQLHINVAEHIHNLFNRWNKFIYIKSFSDLILIYSTNFSWIGVFSMILISFYRIISGKIHKIPENFVKTNLITRQSRLLNKYLLNFIIFYVCYCNIRHVDNKIF